MKNTIKAADGRTYEVTKVSPPRQMPCPQCGGNARLEIFPLYRCGCGMGFQVRETSR